MPPVRGRPQTTWQNRVALPGLRVTLQHLIMFKPSSGHLHCNGDVLHVPIYVLPQRQFLPVCISSTLEEGCFSGLCHPSRYMCLPSSVLWLRLWNPLSSWPRCIKSAWGLPSHGEVEVILWWLGQTTHLIWLEFERWSWKEFRVVGCWTLAWPGRLERALQGKWEDPVRWEVWVSAGTGFIVPGGCVWRPSLPCPTAGFQVSCSVSP